MTTIKKVQKAATPKKGAAAPKAANQKAIVLNSKQTFIFKKLAKASKSLRGYAESKLGVYFEATDRFKQVVSSMKVPADVKDELATKKPATIYDRFIKQFDMFRDRNDITPSKHVKLGTAIGVEIECFSPIPRAALQQLCKERVFKIKDGHCGNDGSVKPAYGATGYEFRVLTNIDDMRNLESLCEFLDYIKAKVNATCGLHIHLDFRDFGSTFPKESVDRLQAALPLLNALVPIGRRNDEYCRTDVSRDEGGDKYSKINAACFHRENMRTVEIRLHSGTTNFEKIKNWILICHSIARHKGPVISGANPADYASALGWSHDLLTYVEKRIKKFRDMPKTLEPVTYRTKVKINLGDIEDYESVA